MKLNTFPLFASLIASLFLGSALPVHAETQADDAVAQDPVLAHYLTIQTALAADSTEGAVAAAASLAAAARAAELEPVAIAAEVMVDSDLATLRDQLKPLSLAMAEAASSGSIDGGQLHYCPMAKGYWLQAKGDKPVRNPYYGASMLRCGGPVEKVDRG